MAPLFCSQSRRCPTMLQSSLLPPCRLLLHPSRRILTVHRKATISGISPAGIPNEALLSRPLVTASHPVLLEGSSLPPPTTHWAKSLGIRPSAELGLLSLVFVVTMAFGAFFSVAVTCLPAMHGFQKLAISLEKLSKVAAEEVPGTLSSFKLSGLEISDLTQQLSNIRRRVSGSQYDRKVKGQAQRRKRGGGIHS